MGVLEKLNVAIVGACGRGKSARAGIEGAGAVVHAVCDLNKEGLAEAKETLGAREAYTDYDEMLANSELDAVVVGTPMPLHVPQSIAALEHGLHVLSEVPAGVSIDECRQLVEACKRSKAVYMMAENACYWRRTMVVTEMVRRGLFGEVYYAEGEYLHELKELGERTKWRRHWQNGIDGITYGTHSLGPILQWFEGDRVARVSCEGSGRHHVDPRGEPYAQDTSVMLCKTVAGRLIKIRVDMLSERPGCCNIHVLQGKDGTFESGRYGGADAEARVWLRDLCDGPEWLSIADVPDEYVPEVWRTHGEAAASAGHGGTDYIEVLDFLDACRGEHPCRIGVHETMDMTLPGLVSQQSIQQGGAWLDVPDSRDW